MVENPVNDGIGEGRAAQCLTPLFKADTCGKDHCNALVTCADQVQQEAGILVFGSYKVNVVYDQEVASCNAGNDFICGIVGHGGIEPGKESLEFEEKDTISCFTCLDTQGGGDMGFSCSGFAKDEDGLTV